MADILDRAEKKTEKRTHDGRDKRLARLVANEDFREWLFGTLFSLCAFENDLRDTTEFERGIRAAGSLIRREIIEGDGAAEMLAGLQKRYFEGVKRGILEARKNENEKEGPR